MINDTKVYTTIVKAIKALGNLAGTYTLRRETSVFNPATSDMVVTVTEVSGNGILDSTQTVYLNEQAQTGAHVLLWLLLDDIPKLDETLVDSHGKIHRIVKIDTYKGNNKNFIHRIGLAV